MANISQQALNRTFTSNQVLPDEGPISIPIPLDFSANADYKLDVQNFMAMGNIQALQSMYVDNGDSDDSLTVFIGPFNGGFRQRIIVKPHTQGYYNILCQSPAQFEFINNDQLSKGQVWLNNFPVGQSTWLTQ